mmetsp:Transcript_47837/g.144690  ORF Transcript_47837/g.144690 Transcript_47837/m.144690 type:complete len:318 (+) Transcript_47837:638-1591(+)
MRAFVQGWDGEGVRGGTRDSLVPPRSYQRIGSATAVAFPSIVRVQSPAHAASGQQSTSLPHPASICTGISIAATASAAVATAEVCDLLPLLVHGPVPSHGVPIPPEALLDDVHNVGRVGADAVGLLLLSRRRRTEEGVLLLAVASSSSSSSSAAAAAVRVAPVGRRGAPPRLPPGRTRPSPREGGRVRGRSPGGGGVGRCGGTVPRASAASAAVAVIVRGAAVDPSRVRRLTQEGRTRRAGPRGRAGHPLRGRTLSGAAPEAVAAVEARDAARSPPSDDGERRTAFFRAGELRPFAAAAAAAAAVAARDAVDAKVSA